jgi:cyclin A
MQRVHRYVEDDLRECVEALHVCHLATQKSSLSAVREKYSQVKFKCVSLIKASKSLLD